MDADLEANANEMLTSPPEYEDTTGRARMIATPKDESDDGFASTMDFRVDEASAGQYSENVMGISRDDVTLVNFSTMMQASSKNIQV